MLTKFGLAVGAVLLASTVSAATIDFAHDGSGLATIGRSGFSLVSSLDYFRTDTADAFDVGFELSTGRARSVTVDASGASRYVFTNGIATFTFEGTESRVQLLPFTIDVSPVTNDPIWGGDGPVAMMQMVELTLGSGKMSHALGQALGVKKQIDGGRLSFVVDDVRGEPSATTTRDGVLSWMGGYLDARGNGEKKHPNERVSEFTAAQAVPEPSLLALMAAGTILTLRRRRQS